MPIINNLTYIAANTLNIKKKDGTKKLEKVRERLGRIKQKGFHHDWREIVRIMSTQKCVPTPVDSSQNQTISIRQCTQPTKAVVTIYDLLNYKHFPFRRKKSVVPLQQLKK